MQQVKWCAIIIPAEVAIKSCWRKFKEESMKTLEWKNEDKRDKDWPKGEWDNEPDKIQWVDPTTNLPCLMVRNHSGAWCGYVGVAEGHPAFGVHYDRVNVEVHGGLTFSDTCLTAEHLVGKELRKGVKLMSLKEAQAYVEANSICHVVEEGENDNVWWLGFDCAHYMDIAPGMLKYNIGTGHLGEQYRNRDYVKAEVECLATQLANNPTIEPESEY
jgi:hypothetical protein